ncbi:MULTISPECIES: SCO6880 family protein [unclassified Kitasatospora]|uniref:SCO6880 family protein n=1 Tax=unclassified Kitasatospora TaxID=2633591 RepID=UPI0033FB878A
MSASDLPLPTVRFPSRSRRGVLLGLSVAQLTVVGTAGALLLATMVATGLAGAALATPVWALAAALVIVRVHSRSIADWSPIATRFYLRRAKGQLVWLARPATRPRRDGLLHLPGTAASLRAVTAPGGTLGAVHDPQKNTLTAAIRVSSRAFALLDPPTQSANVSAWGRCLASLARTGYITTVQVIERTVPDSGDALQRYWAEHGRPDAKVAGPVYEELLAASGPTAAPHECYIAVSLDLKAARRLIGEAGGGLVGAFAVLAQLVPGFEQSLRNAGLNPGGWLTTEEFAAVIRSAYDPKALAHLEQWSETGQPTADPAAAGPVVVVEEPARLTTDTACHAVYWIEQWPRSEVAHGFLHPLIFAGGARRTLSLTYGPQALEAALKAVQRTKASIIADAAERVRKGQVDSEADSMEYADAKQHERELIAGHADVDLTGLVVVSADTPEELRRACASIETAAAGTGLDPRLLRWQQADAFTQAALPLART